MPLPCPFQDIEHFEFALFLWNNCIFNYMMIIAISKVKIFKTLIPFQENPIIIDPQSKLYVIKVFYRFYSSNP